jgi:CRISPR-associated protein Cas5h
MEQHNLLVFDIGGEYGHFRKFNTTSSPLTYPVPPRTALIGVLGAILGIEREVAPGKFRKDQASVHEVFSKEHANIAIQLLNPIKKVNMAFNLLDTGKSGSSFFNITNRTQIEFELLKDPKYRVFIQLQDNALHSRLAQSLQKRSHYFTPYLGLSQFIADISWVGATTGTVYENRNKDYIPIQSVINLTQFDKEPPLQFGDIKVTAETIPIMLNNQRIVQEYAQVLIEQQGRTVSVATPAYVETPYGNLVYL